HPGLRPVDARPRTPRTAANRGAVAARRGSRRPDLPTPRRAVQAALRAARTPAGTPADGDRAARLFPFLPMTCTRNETMKKPSFLTFWTLASTLGLAAFVPAQGAVRIAPKPDATETKSK